MVGLSSRLANRYTHNAILSERKSRLKDLRCGECTPISPIRRGGRRTEAEGRGCTATETTVGLGDDCVYLCIVKLRGLQDTRGHLTIIRASRGPPDKNGQVAAEVQRLKDQTGAE